MEIDKYLCDAHSNELKAVEINIAKINKDIEQIKNDTKYLKTEVKNLIEKPYKRYDVIVGYVINAVLILLIGYFTKFI